MSAVQIDLAKECQAPAEHLWDILVSPRLWWGEGVVLDPVSGGRFFEPWKDAAGEHHTHGRVLEIQAPNFLLLKWWDEGWSFETEVSLQISALKAGSHIRLVHSGWQAAPEAEQRDLIAAHRQGWSYHLENLVTFAGKN